MSKITILSDKDKLIRKIKIAIRVSPDTDIEYPEGSQDLKWPNDIVKMYEHYVEDKWYPITDPTTPKITLTSGGLTITVFKTKKILTELLKRVEKMPETMVVEEELLIGYTIRRGGSPNRQVVGELIKGMPDGTFTDGIMLCKGTPPGKVIWNEKVYSLDMESIVSSVLNASTEPAELSYHVVMDGLDIGVSSEPIIQLIDVSDNPKIKKDPPYVIFKSSYGFARYDQYRHNVIKKRYPDAIYGMTANGQLIAYMESSEGDGGHREPVASIMCYRVNRDDEGVTSNPYGYDMATELGLVRVDTIEKED